MGVIFTIQGGERLQGSITANGAKNAALPIMAACLLCKGEFFLERVPNISDVEIMREILEYLGAKITFDGKGNMQIDSRNIHSTRAPYDLVRKIHASFDITGPLLAHFKEVDIVTPGGCNLGHRAINFHLDGFKVLGAEVPPPQHGVIKVKAKRLKGNRMVFPRPSVGATKNVMMAATLAHGVTILEQCAQEPEIADLANFLNQMGAKIKGAGTARIEIRGVDRLSGGFVHRIISDRIEAGTFLLAGAITKGEVKVDGIDPAHLEAFLVELERANQIIKRGHNYIHLKSRKDILPLKIATKPYPGFPTDLHPPMVALLTLANGTSTLEENIFEGRFMYVDELARLGANIEIENKLAVIRGIPKLIGAQIEAPDIRAGGALVLAALAAEGKSEVSGLEYIDRGYEKFEKRLRTLGAKIRRIEKDAHRN